MFHKFCCWLSSSLEKNGRNRYLSWWFRRTWFFFLMLIRMCSLILRSLFLSYAYRKIIFNRYYVLVQPAIHVYQYWAIKFRKGVVPVSQIHLLLYSHTSRQCTESLISGQRVIIWSKIYYFLTRWFSVVPQTRSVFYESSFDWSGFHVPWVVPFNGGVHATLWINFMFTVTYLSVESVISSASKYWENPLPLPEIYKHSI